MSRPRDLSAASPVSAPKSRSIESTALGLAALALALSGCGIALRAADLRLAPRVGRADLIFGARTPILFAHRGGVLEAPESTEMAFCHAVRHARADVLEIDLQTTRDERFVVWHGPSLDNVRIDGQALTPSERQRRGIYEYDWDELRDKAWVADPWFKGRESASLEAVPRSRGRRLLSLKAFLRRFPCQSVNIELKESIEEDDLPRLIRTLDAAPPCPWPQAMPRRILVVSLSEPLLHSFRQRRCCYPTGLSIEGNLATVLRSWLLPFPHDMTGRALQTSEIWLRDTRGRQIVHRVHADGAPVHVFVSDFLGCSLDEEANGENCEAIRDLLDLGADGIMTDRPRWVRQVIDRWPDGEEPCEMRAPDADHLPGGQCLRCEWTAPAAGE